MDQSFRGKEFENIHKVLNDFWLDSLQKYYSCNFFSKPKVPCNFTIINPHSEEEMELCVEALDECDGIPHCPNLADEDLERCAETFPSSHSLVTCHASDMFNNVTISVKGIQCNGRNECDGGIEKSNVTKYPHWNQHHKVFDQIHNHCQSHFPIHIFLSLNIIWNGSWIIIPIRHGCWNLAIFHTF